MIKWLARSLLHKELDEYKKKHEQGIRDVERALGISRQNVMALEKEFIRVKSYEITIKDLTQAREILDDERLKLKEQYSSLARKHAILEEQCKQIKEERDTCNVKVLEQAMHLQEMSQTSHPLRDQQRKTKNK